MNIKVLASGSTGNCIVLEENKRIILLDAGISLPEIKRGINYKVSDVLVAFISHVHLQWLDHSKSADKLRNMGIPMFEPYKGGSQVFTRDGFYMKGFPLEHDGVENRGVYLMTPSGEKIIYATDFSYVKYKFTNLKINHFLLECNHMDEISEEDNRGKMSHVLRGHSSVSTVCEFLRVNRTDELKTVILCHLSETNSDAKEMVYRVKEIVGSDVNVWIAGKGVELNLNE